MVWKTVEDETWNAALWCVQLYVNADVSQMTARSVSAFVTEWVPSNAVEIGGAVTRNNGAFKSWLMVEDSSLHKSTGILSTVFGVNSAMNETASKHNVPSCKDPHISTFFFGIIYKRSLKYCKMLKSPASVWISMYLISWLTTFFFFILFINLCSFLRLFNLYLFVWLMH